MKPEELREPSGERNDLNDVFGSKIGRVLFKMRPKAWKETVHLYQCSPYLSHNLSKPGLFSLV